MRPPSAVLAPAILLAALAAPARAEEPPQPAIVQDVQVEADWVILTLSQAAAYSTKMQAEPPMLSVTLDNAVISDAAKNRTVSDGTVRGVSSERFLAGGVNHVRMDFQLDTARAFTPSWNGNELTIKLQGPAAKAAAAPTAPAPTPAPAPAAMPVPAPAPAPAPVAPVAAPAAPPPPAPAPAPAVEKPAASQPPAPRHAFRVQFGSFPKERSAQRLQKQLEPKLGAVEVRQAEVAGKTVYRVTLGAFARRAAAKDALEQAAAKGATGIIVRD